MEEYNKRHNTMMNDLHSLMYVEVDMLNYSESATDDEWKHIKERAAAAVSALCKSLSEILNDKSLKEIRCRAKCPEGHCKLVFSIEALICEAYSYASSLAQELARTSSREDHTCAVSGVWKRVSKIASIVRMD
jgi:ElaB/YqjD/DUF883 family membrane-anchored ribosome-binding protein